MFTLYVNHPHYDGFDVVECKTEVEAMHAAWKSLIAGLQVQLFKKPDGETSEGEAITRMVEPAEVVKQAFEIADAFLAGLSVGRS